MLRVILIALAAFVLLTASFVPDDAYARGGRGGGGRGGGGGFHGGGGFRGGGMRPSHPIAGRPGRPIAGRPGYGGGYRPGLGYGAAAVGAAAVGAAVVAGAPYGGYGYDPYYEHDDGEPYVAAESDPIAECARRFKSYDPASQTYIKRKGVRASCP